MNSFHIGINSYQTGMNSYQIGMNLYQTKSIILGWSPIAQSRKDRFKKFFHIHVPKFGPEFWVRLKHPNSRINQYQPGMNLYQIGMNLYQIGMNLYQIGINSYRFRFSYTAWCPEINIKVLAEIRTFLLHHHMFYSQEQTLQVWPYNFPAMCTAKRKSIIFANHI